MNRRLVIEDIAILAMIFLILYFSTYIALNGPQIVHQVMAALHDPVVMMVLAMIVFPLASALVAIGIRLAYTTGGRKDLLALSIAAIAVGMFAIAASVFVLLDLFMKSIHTFFERLVPRP